MIRNIVVPRALASAVLLDLAQLEAYERADGHAGEADETREHRYALREILMPHTAEPGPESSASEGEK